MNIEDRQLIHFDESINYSKDDILSFLYLNEEVKSLIVRSDSNYFIDNNISSEDFFISDQDKIKIKLSKNYSSVEQCLTPLDQNLKFFLSDKFGINKPEEALQDRILIYENNAFIELVQPYGVHALTVELAETNVILLGIAYIIVE